MNQEMTGRQGVGEHRFFARWYDTVTGPLERRWLGRVREELLADLGGQILEIGAGTGANLAHYRRADHVVAAEPDPAMRERLRRRLGEARVPVELSPVRVEDLPFGDDTFDVVVSTLVLCSVADLPAALAEVRRVLRPAGRLVVIEHVRDDGVRGRAQDALAPLWRRLAAGCHLNRDIATAIRTAGLEAGPIDTFRPRPTLPILHRWIRGTATPPEM
ncbi:methyltransferase domain-containing protein [Nonomuraea sp. B12E4]|uniref:class I SAM-dependent methyltransferase n=1 Tax=Nonomuraea sp. B12E4 TaxID=3153564 RepID=UPI00325E7327